MAGVAVVMFCLFLWMFLLGIWAGQTILLPLPDKAEPGAETPAPSTASPVKILRPEGVKSPVPRKSSMVERHRSRQIAVIFLK